MGYKAGKVYRARGTPIGGGRARFITTVYRRTPREAQEDIKLYGHRYINTKIVALDWIKEVNKGKRRAHPRLR